VVIVSRAEARLRVAPVVVVSMAQLPTHRGFFYHFANINTGERMWDSEVSSVDTDDSAVRYPDLAASIFRQTEPSRSWRTPIFDRVEWTWLAEDTTAAGRTDGPLNWALFPPGGISTAS